MAIIIDGTTVENVLYKSSPTATPLQLDKVIFEDVVVWENWKIKTGRIDVPSGSASNGWGGSGWKDLGKEIIPLAGTVHFSWSMSGGQYSTSCGAGLSGKTPSEDYTFASHSRGDFGKNGSGSSTENWSNPNNKKPIRYVKSFCGGGTGGGSTRYSSSGTITKWLEKGA